MKKYLFLVMFLSIGLGSLQAQSNLEAGIRFSNQVSLDMTIPVGMAPRLHPTVYFDRFGVGAYFDWMFAISGGPSGLKFYPGLGPEFFFGNSFDFDIAGNFGAEYSFDFPLTLGFDWRPGFRVSNGFAFKSSNWGFMARIRLGKGVKFVKSN